METAERASEPAGRASELAGRALELAGTAPEPTGRALEPDGKPGDSWEARRGMEKKKNRAFLLYAGTRGHRPLRNCSPKSNEKVIRRSKNGNIWG